jgi:hypothetical protein
VKTKFLLSVLAAVVSTVSLHAGEVRGVVSVVLPDSVTVATDKLGEMAYAVSAQTKVLSEAGQAGSLKDLSQGTAVEIVTGSDPNQAVEIRIVPPKPSERQ